MARENNFISDYEQIRSFVRMMFLYDDFTEEAAKDYGISGKYGDYKKILSAYINENNYDNSKRINGKIAASLKNSMFRNSYNYLCDTYVMKNLVKTKIEGFIHILQMYDYGKMKIRLKKNLQKFPTQKDYDDIIQLHPEIYISNLSRNINEFAELGYLEIDKTQKANWSIKLSDNPLDNIDTEDKALAFLDALSLMRNFVQPYLCGHMLYQTALNTFREKGLVSEYESPYVIADSHFEQVLDDEVLWQIMQAIDGRHKIKFNYQNGKDERTVVPLEVVTNAESGRRYLLAADENDGLVSLRLDRISNVEKCAEVFVLEDYSDRLNASKKYSFSGSVLLNSENSPTEIVLEFLPEMHTIVQKLFPDCEITKTDNYFSAKVFLNDPREIKPWLRRNMGSVKVREGCSLADEISAELSEWRAVYGDI
ncbi:MAG: WYL domain-containing protein [Oscillospiraceae bacterium]|nr:WYL domain-containing protein [Oscillospiraceae bacterium]